MYRLLARDPILRFFWRGDFALTSVGHVILPCRPDAGDCADTCEQGLVHFEVKNVPLFEYDQ